MYSPGSGLFPRVALKNVTIEDILIKKGEIVNVNIYALQMNPSIFKNPYEFNPERWNNKELVDPY